jgi:putative hydrolase of the HAD superfamily
LSDRLFKAVLFDAGATLLHSDPPVEEIYVRELTKDGVEAGREDFRRALAETWREVREKKLSDRYGGVSGERGFWKMFVNRARFHLDGRELSEPCFERLVSHFIRTDSWSVFPDVLPTLEVLAAGGYRLAVVSNWDSTLLGVLEAHGLSRFFSAILVSALEKTGKPDPEIFHRACRRLGIEEPEALHVGDSKEEDFDAAREAGLAALLLDRDGRHGSVSERISSLSEIPARLGSAARPISISAMEGA